MSLCLREGTVRFVDHFLPQARGYPSQVTTQAHQARGALGPRLPASAMDPLTKLAHTSSGPLGASLTFLGLSMVWFFAFLYVCHQNDVTPTGKDVPSRLFALGSVYGMERPTIEVVWRTSCAGVLGMCALGVCDLLYARKTKARWFGLHVIANVWISILCLPDLWFILSDPISALTTRSCNHWPTALVFSVHVYHVAFFRNLSAACRPRPPPPCPSPPPAPAHASWAAPAVILLTGSTTS